VTATARLPSGMTSRHSSESSEHYTPQEIVEAARTAMGPSALKLHHRRGNLGRRLPGRVR
jgi:hypothetical protein